jgi:hypothetical protein
MRQPTIRPVIIMMTMTSALLTRSEVVRPIRTAERAIGSERNRSMMPLVMSSARPLPVMVAPNSTVCAKMPAIRNSR